MRRGSREVNKGANDVGEIRISPDASRQLSDVRRNMIHRDVESGIVVESGKNYNGSMLKKNIVAGSQSNSNLPDIDRGEWDEQSGQVVSRGSGRPSNYLKKTAQAVIANSSSFKKQASISSTSNSSGYSGGSHTDRLAPEVYSPLFTMANLNLPRDRITINSWIRNFYDLHPIVRNCITLHATYPISKLNIRCHDQKVEQFFSDMVEEMDLLGTLGELSLEFWKLGEVVPYAVLDENEKKWKRINILNPDFVHVKKAAIGGYPIISLRPDEALKRLVMSSHPADQHIRSQIPEEIIHHVRKGQNIPLDNFNASHLKMLSSPYDIRGTSIVVSCFKDLMLFDKLREAKFAQADGLINPITLVKVGGNAEGEARLTSEDLEEWRQIMEEAQYDKDFKIITHAGVAIERIGANGQIIDVAGDIELIIKNLYTGLMVPQAVVDTESAVYSSASIGLEVLRQRYFNFRNLIAKWLVNKIFAPISKMRGFFEYKDGEKKLIIPEVEWNHMNLYDLSDYVQTTTGLLSTQQCSLQTIYRSIGLNYEEEKRKQREEMIDLAKKQREEQALAKYSLEELRSMDSSKEIQEASEGERPGAAGAGAPGAGGDMGMGGDMGGMGGDMGGMGGDMGGGMGGELAPPPSGELGGGGGGMSPEMGPGAAPPM